MRTLRNLLHSLLAIAWPAVAGPSAASSARTGPGTGGELLREGRFDEAEQAFARSLRSRPDDARTLLGFGYLAILRNGLAEAEQRLRRALALDPGLREAHGLLAEVHYRRDDFAQAAPHFEKAGQRAKARKLASFVGRQPNRIEGAGAVARLPFLKTDPLPILALRVNGEPGRFLLDTGGGELILDRAFADRVAAPRFGAERSYFGGGKHARVEHGRVDSVGLGEIRVHDVPINVMDLAPIGPALGEPRIDGILGTVLLYHFRSTIDYAGGELVLERTGPTAPASEPADAERRGEVTLPFWLADDHIVVAWGSVNGGRPLLFFVDTGLAGAGFTCPPSTIEQAGIELRRDQAGSGRGGGGAMSIVPFVVSELSLGGLRREHIDGAAGPFPPQLEWDLGFRLGGLVSHQFFRPGSLTLDFAAMQMRLRAGGASRPRPAQPEVCSPAPSDQGDSR